MVPIPRAPLGILLFQGIREIVATWLCQQLPRWSSTTGHRFTGTWETTEQSMTLIRTLRNGNQILPLQITRLLHGLISLNSNLQRLALFPFIWHSEITRPFHLRRVPKRSRSSRIGLTHQCFGSNAWRMIHAIISSSFTTTGLNEDW